MERHKLCEAMARRIGQPLTVDMATEIVREAIPQQLVPVALPAMPTREQIERLEGDLIAAEAAGGMRLEDGTELVPLELDAWHHFADGLVSRTILIPTGAALTGAEHRAEHLNICCGDISVWTEHGMKRLTGYHVIPSLPHAKRVGYAHADTYWTTVHLNPGNERDIEKLEDALVVSGQLQSRRLMLPTVAKEKLR
jgi:hypothetical protein